MNLYILISTIITIAILVAYLNHRFIKMQTTIAVMTASLMLSMLTILVGHFTHTHVRELLTQAMQQVDFHALLMQGMLSFLLFAGSLNININHLKDRKWEIGTLATIGTLLSTFLIGAVFYYLLPYFGISMRFIDCLIFGALISPTDPIAVLATFKSLKINPLLHVFVEGESLFNDGVAIVIFLTIFHLAYIDTNMHWQNVATLFLRQSLGGILYGAGLGLFVYYLLKPIDDLHTQILVTLIIPTGGYALANAMGVSGPLAMVVAGIFIGNRGKQFSMKKSVQEHLDMFWSLIDEVLNAVLFLLMGLEILVIPMHRDLLIIGLLAIPLVLLIRFVSVFLPMSCFKLWKSYTPYTVRILTWGGLRGGLAVALALSLPHSTARTYIISMTYAVVVFAIIIQGLTIKPLAKRSILKEEGST